MARARFPKGSSKVGKASAGRTSLQNTPVTIRSSVKLGEVFERNIRTQLASRVGHAAGVIGRITVRFERVEGGGAVLSVNDTGYGIPEPHLARLTERFYRVSSSRTRETGGTGLGLAIVKHVLQLHQARLEITSEVGRGSTFSCHFGPARMIARTDDTHDESHDQTPADEHA